MEIAFTQQALADLKYWKKVGNKTIQKKYHSFWLKW